MSTSVDTGAGGTLSTIVACSGERIEALKWFQTRKMSCLGTSRAGERLGDSAELIALIGVRSLLSVTAVTGTSSVDV